MEHSMDNLAIAADDESGVHLPNMVTSMFLGNQLPVFCSDPNNPTSSHINNQGHNHATKFNSISTNYVVDAYHSSSIPRPAGSSMNTEGSLIIHVFDEEMGSENEDSPLVHADGLKRPIISASAKAFSSTGDMGTVASAWTLENDCEDVVRQCWSETQDSLPNKLKALSVTLSNWNKDRKSNQSKKVRDWEAKLKNLEEQDPDENILASILDIKLDLNVEADKEDIYWEQRFYCLARPDNTREYSVKSNYKMLVSSSQQDLHALQHVASMARVFYDSLWNSKILSKTKITVWRFARNFLPTRSNLSARHLVNDSSCPFCHHSSKLVQHLGFECTVTIQVLTALHINIPARDPDMEWSSWLDYCISSLSKSNAALLFVTLWAIWGFRNKLVHENVSPALDSYVLFIRNYASDTQSLSW
ncbi:hypothetical protein V6N12_051230 [Hibiscus sabdariffa]|uniref:Reverse transcriptase zinc-binding domain-containing protein n=1 Tax=Hibiscus sabdariffa TaxID=183260 RepID=A0ABR2GFB8_9ROSI